VSAVSFVIRSRTRLQQFLAVESRERATPVNHCPAAIGAEDDDCHVMAVMAVMIAPRKQDDRRRRRRVSTNLHTWPLEALSHWLARTQVSFLRCVCASHDQSIRATTTITTYQSSPLLASILASSACMLVVLVGFRVRGAGKQASNPASAVRLCCADVLS
jgi:hypothetical protein